MKIIWKECQKSVNLQRVFHGIRFILRLVKIACREISNFFMSAVPAGMTLAHTVLIFVAGLLVLLPTVFHLARNRACHLETDMNNTHQKHFIKAPRHTKKVVTTLTFCKKHRL